MKTALFFAQIASLHAALIRKNGSFPVSDTTLDWGVDMLPPKRTNLPTRPLFSGNGCCTMHERLLL
ncbi:hypothetical protein [uncultured Shimia sp.]|uniref:hypothetical protein n=1 Tax=uncultured Shimia sp. TaxID=573152 RepID=UPI00261FBBC6|nr:hypothetical protein [uncultured Shimia sp.]